MFIIQPPHPWWKEMKRENAKPLSEGFYYASNNNPEQLTIDEIRQLIEETKPFIERRSI